AEFYDVEALERELERVYDICHGCRRCFSLCNAFPTLFDAVDASAGGEVAGIEKKVYWQVVDHCYLCDMCFMTKCPYVPPHPFNVDFPHLMLRHRAGEVKEGNKDFTQRQLAEMDRNGRLAVPFSPLVNWGADKNNKLTRPLMEKLADIDRHASLPTFASQTFIRWNKKQPVEPNKSAPAYGTRKAALYATCFVNYNRPSTGMAARAVLNHLGVETRAAYPGCCGMPFLEQ